MDKFNLLEYILLPLFTDCIRKMITAKEIINGTVNGTINDTVNGTVKFKTINEEAALN